ncbi:phospholipase D-like domain-containing protein [Pontibacter litorisediminis]|uniref:phospholipase D-like domain-containing protein n=1 Tax=Pontibacter litorisediminis TaxID=1846260 RepID=UPI0023ED58E3|nr:phospholipase D-like domain-containing protein [Pontibacter litorisediminis]
MQYLRLLFVYIFLFLISACSSSDDEPDTPQPELPAAAKPVTASFPEAVFTSPDKLSRGTSSTEILDRLIALIDATPEGAEIHISIYMFDYAELVDALERADARGVKLHLMLDLSREESQKINPYTIKQLKAKLSENAELVVVDSDAGSIAINHNKFVLFSKVLTQAGEATDLVLQTSHNFILSGTRKVQDAVFLTHKGLYGAYLGYWQDMKQRAQQGMTGYNYTEYHDPAAGISAYFLPKRREGAAYGEDSIIELLQKITEPSGAVIRIGMSDWTSSRMNIVEKLAELLDQGATIELVVKSSISEDILAGLRALEEKGAYLKVYNMTESSKLQVNIHAKFLLIEGAWEGENANIVITGSHNFTQNALRNNNETMLLLKDHALYDTYTAYFEELKAIPGL